jgi:hypothetical protein
VPGSLYLAWHYPTPSTGRGDAEGVGAGTVALLYGALVLMIAALIRSSPP